MGNRSVKLQDRWLPKHNVKRMIVDNVDHQGSDENGEEKVADQRCNS
jgi:hypothetical protein